MNDAVIHFAHVSSRYLEKVCLRAVEELKDQSKLIKHAPPPELIESMADQLRAQLSGVDLSVHLLDDDPGMDLGDGISYSQKQIEIVRELGIPQLIWVSDRCEEDDFEGDYGRFLQELETGNRDGADYEFIHASKNVVAERILERIERLQRQSSTSSDNTAEIDVLIDSHLNDFPLTSRLVKLFGENDISFEINIPQGGPLENINLFETKLQQSKKLLLVFGNVEESWVRERLAHVTQLMITRGYRLDCNVYAAPPPKDRLDDWLDSRFATVIDNSASTDPDPAIVKVLLNGSASATVEKTPQDDDLTSGQRQRLQQKITEQKKIHERLSSLLEKLYDKKIIETRPEEKLRLEHSIKDAESERDSVDQKLTELERQL